MYMSLYFLSLLGSTLFSEPPDWGGAGVVFGDITGFETPNLVSEIKKIKFNPVEKGKTKKETYRAHIIS